MNHEQNRPVEQQNSGAAGDADPAGVSGVNPVSNSPDLTPAASLPGDTPPAPVETENPATGPGNLSCGHATPGRTCGFTGPPSAFRKDAHSLLRCPKCDSSEVYSVDVPGAPSQQLDLVDNLIDLCRKIDALHRTCTTADPIAAAALVEAHSTVLAAVKELTKPPEAS